MVTVLDEIRFTVVLLAHKARSYGCADSHPVANRAGLPFCPPLATTPVAAQPRLARGPGANPFPELHRVRSRHKNYAVRGNRVDDGNGPDGIRRQDLSSSFKG